ncbi:MAG: hypothetical protein IJC83_06455 [Oscillospiraceae bacterium]|nr:hypothetical protein [Oscillospiraceae bacterium]
MPYLYILVLVFSALTLYFTYAEYKKEKILKNRFILISVLYAVVIIATTILFIMSF